MKNFLVLILPLLLNFWPLVSILLCIHLRTDLNQIMYIFPFLFRQYRPQIHDQRVFKPPSMWRWGFLWMGKCVFKMYFISLHLTFCVFIIRGYYGKLQIANFNYINLHRFIKQSQKKYKHTVSIKYTKIYSRLIKSLVSCLFFCIF